MANKNNYSLDEILRMIEIKKQENLNLKRKIIEKDKKLKEMLALLNK